jgi:hypothetical protein
LPLIFVVAGMFHLSYHLLWQLREKNMKRKLVNRGYKCHELYFEHLSVICWYLILNHLHYTLQEEEKPKEKEKGKSRNIDHFMEELKREQEMRERRNQEREHWRDGRHNEHSAVSGFQC